MNNKIAALMIGTACVAALVFSALAMSSHASDTISQDQAKLIAIDAAGFKPREVGRVQSEYGIDKGIVEYEIDFIHGNTKYEYEIDATTGAILDYNVEI